MNQDELAKYKEREYELEEALDELENSRRQINDDLYRKFRKRLLAKRRYNTQRIIELEARV